MEKLGNPRKIYQVGFMEDKKMYSEEEVLVKFLEVMKKN
jgi:hypothetical protein